jgi:branched-chain amino acid transport system permease protein
MLLLIVGTILDGMILAGIYALAALGFVIIYRATGVFNFAQGEFMMLGAYLTYFVTATTPLPIWMAALLALLGILIIGVAIFLLIVRPLTGQPLFAVIIVTMGVSIFLRAVVGLVAGPTPFFLSNPFAGIVISLGQFGFLPAFDLFAFIVTLVTYGAVIVFLRFSPIGLEMRAAAESPALAGQRGVNLTLVFAVSWGIAALVAAVAGAVYAGRTAVSPGIAGLGMSAFPAALVGGFDSVGGTLIGAFVVAMAETAAIMIWGAESKDVVAAAILLGVLMIRPYGLFGTPQVLRI